MNCWDRKIKNFQANTCAVRKEGERLFTRNNITGHVPITESLCILISTIHLLRFYMQ